MNLSFKSYWFRSGFFSFFQRFSMAFFGFVNFYILIRQFSIEEYGIWTLYVSVGAILEVIRHGFIRNPFIKFYTAEQERPKVVTASLMLNITLTLLFAVVILLFSKTLGIFWDAPEIPSLLYIYIFSNLFVLFLTHFDYIQLANLDFKGSFFSGFTRRSLFFCFILICYLTNYPLSLIQLAIFEVIAVFIGALVSYFFSRKYSAKYGRIDKNMIIGLLNFGKYTFGTSMSTMLHKNTDKWMLGSMLTPTATAFYDPALRVSNLIEVPTISVASIVFPQMAKRIQTDGLVAAKYLYERSVGLILAIMLPAFIAIILFPEAITVLVAGEKYRESAPILQVTILYAMFVPFSRQFGVVMDAIGRPKLNFHLVLLTAILNVIFNYLFIKHVGIIGAAYGTLSTYFLNFLIVQIILGKQLRVNTFNTLVYMKSFYIAGIEAVVTFIKRR